MKTNFDKNLKEIKEMIPFSSTTNIGDIVFIMLDEIKLYAKVTDIVRDLTVKATWWHVSFTVLALPIIEIKWTLREEQFTGIETFTIDGKDCFVAAVDFYIQQRLIDKRKEKAEKPKLSIVKKNTNGK